MILLWWNFFFFFFLVEFCSATHLSSISPFLWSVFHFLVCHHICISNTFHCIFVKCTCHFFYRICIFRYAAILHIPLHDCAASSLRRCQFFPLVPVYCRPPSRCPWLSFTPLCFTNLKKIMGKNMRKNMGKVMRKIVGEKL